MKEDIIIAVQNRPPLWDKRHKLHYNRHVLDKEWKTIAAELKTTDKTVKQVWKNLRQEFRKQFNKSLMSGAGAPDETPNWKYFNSMLFLQDQFIPRQSTGNLSLSLEEELTEQSGNEDNDLEDMTELSSVEVGNSNCSKDNRFNKPRSRSLSPPTEARPTNINMSESVYTRTGFKRKITTQAAIGRELLLIEKEKLNFKRNKVEENRNDEDVGFFNSLLPHVKTLNPRKKMQFRMKVQEILFEMAYTPEYSATIPVGFKINESQERFPTYQHL